MPSPSDTERLRATIDAVQAPPELHARIAERLVDARRRRGQRLRLSVGGALTAAAAATAAVLAIVLPGGGGQPTVLEVSQLSAAPPTQPAPAVHGRYGQWLDARVGDVWFPSWRQAPGWRATGARRDAIDGRTATTVYYGGRAGRRLAYTIVSGAPLAWPEHARVTQRGGTAFHVLRHGGRRIVTWREGGHQCVIAAPPTVPEDRLVALAAWAAQNSNA